ncbi:MAG: zinc ribbon domain-containing protein [Acidimicrobiales bacterium]|nr:zinc ribbon domain-containing protein [Acidimicrobiales bacterium]
MPVYEYVCRVCDARFEARRAMSEANEPIGCPDGHADTTRLLSVFATVGGSTAPSSGPTNVGCGPGCLCAQ